MNFDDDHKYTKYHSDTQKEIKIQFVPNTQENGNNIYTTVRTNDKNAIPIYLERKQEVIVSPKKQIEIPITSQLFYGSVSILGLYVVFRLIQNSRS